LSEFKGALQPVSLFATLNQTDDEYEGGFMRINIDKLRGAKGKHVIPIATDWDNGTFYDNVKSLNFYKHTYSDYGQEER